MSFMQRRLFLKLLLREVVLHVSATYIHPLLTWECIHEEESGNMIDFRPGPDPHDILGRKRGKRVESTYKSKN